MPRRSRKRSSSGIYHVMLRGTNKQRIFHDQEDHLCFLRGLEKYRALCGFHLYAYCLMPNHVHLLLREGVEGEAVGNIMLRLTTWYVYRYNRKYERSGALFDGRYKSEPVEDDNYFLTVLRYIHRNPLKAGIANSLSHYPYCSFTRYESPAADQLIEKEMLFSLIPRTSLKEWHEATDHEKCLDMSEHRAPKRLTDEAALAMMKKAGKVNNTEEFLHLNEKQKAAVIRKMISSGASLRQTVRLTGVSMAMVRKMATF